MTDNTDPNQVTQPEISVPTTMTPETKVEETPKINLADPATVPTVPAPEAAPEAPPEAAPEAPPEAPAKKEDDDSSFNLDTSEQRGGSFGFLKGIMKKGDGSSADGNAFTKLFGKSDSGPKTPTPSIRGVLGPQPKVSSTVLYDQELKRRGVATTAMTFAVLAGLAVYGFFYFQLNPNAVFLQNNFDSIGPNVAIQFDASNIRLEKTKTDLNLANYMRARILLDDVNSKIDPYLKQARIITSEFSTNSQISIAESEIVNLRGAINTKLAKAQEIFAQDIGVLAFSVEPISGVENDKKFKDLLVKALNDRKETLHGSAPERAVVDTGELDGVIRLVQNQFFVNLIAKANLDEMDQEQFTTLLMNIREQGTDEHSAVQSIISKRLNWSQVIKDVQAVTRSVDSEYGSGLFDKGVGNFEYSSYSFDTDTGQISIRGQIKTDNSYTFSRISDLVEELEKSRKFKNVALPTFSKSKNDKGEYSSSLNLTFELQGKDEVDTRDAAIENDLDFIETES